VAGEVQEEVVKSKNEDNQMFKSRQSKVAFNY